MDPARLKGVGAPSVAIMVIVGEVLQFADIRPKWGRYECEYQRHSPLASAV